MSVFIIAAYFLWFLAFCGIVAMTASVLIFFNLSNRTKNDWIGFAYLFVCSFLLFAIPTYFAFFNK